jgi:hypothetical protein
MEYLEFHCSECRCGLRIRAEHREKTIRCPNCHALQRYNPSPALNVSPFVDPPAVPSPIDLGAWSLKLPDGVILGNLTRTAFEAEVRTRNLGYGTLFQGGDFTQWTPLEKLFQSQVPSKADKAGAGGWVGHGMAISTPIPVSPTSPYGLPQMSTGTPAVPAHASGTAGSIPPTYRSSPNGPRVALPLERQLPDPRAHLVLAMGIVGMLLPCTFVFSLIGLTLGTTDVMQMGNGTMSQKGSTMLTIGLVLNVLGVFIGGCCLMSMLG